MRMPSKHSLTRVVLYKTVPRILAVQINKDVNHLVGGTVKGQKKKIQISLSQCDLMAHLGPITLKNPLRYYFYAF